MIFDFIHGIRHAASRVKRYGAICRFDKVVCMIHEAQCSDVGFSRLTVCALPQQFFCYRVRDTSFSSCVYAGGMVDMEWAIYFWSDMKSSEKGRRGVG